MPRALPVSAEGAGEGGTAAPEPPVFLPRGQEPPVFLPRGVMTVTSLSSVCADPTALGSRSRASNARSAALCSLSSPTPFCSHSFFPFWKILEDPQQLPFMLVIPIDGPHARI